MVSEIWGIEARSDRAKTQGLGSAVRELDSNAWIELLFREWDIQSFDRGLMNPIVVDDVRYPNEAYALKGAGFVLVRITAGYHSRIHRLTNNGKFQTMEQLEHISETAGDAIDCDYEIWNTGAPADMEAELIKILTKERRKR